MIKLPEISKENEKRFLEKIKPEFLEWCKKNLSPKVHANLYNYLKSPVPGTLFDDNKIENIIIGDKATLEKIIREVKDLKCNDIIDELYVPFSKTEFGKKWANLNGVKTCPYCNRSYIFSVHDKNKNVRPEYDHYFSKSKYPYLCVSMYNLIPCCSVCNKAKGSFDVTKKGGFIYPFMDEYGYDIVFDLKYDSPIDLSNGNNLMVDICNYDGTKVSDPKIKNAISQLALKELYQQHIDYIQDLILLLHIYTNDFVNGLQNDFAWLFLNKESIMDCLFLSRLDKNEWGKRILSKLTYDIIKKYSY